MLRRRWSGRKCARYRVDLAKDERLHLVIVEEEGQPPRPLAHACQDSGDCGATAAAARPTWREPLLADAAGPAWSEARGVYQAFKAEVVANWDQTRN